MTSMTNLVVEINGLRGSVPHTVSSMTRLQFLRVADNSLSGTLLWKEVGV